MLGAGMTKEPRRIQDSALALIIALNGWFVFVEVPVLIDKINEGHVAAAKEHRLTQYENQLQWEAMLDRFFILRCNIGDDGLPVAPIGDGVIKDEPIQGPGGER